MDFVKMHGAGNDFVLLPDPDGAMELTPTLVRALCRPHLGLGADGVIRVAPADVDGAQVFMDYWNADGTVAETCGNGIRCVAKHVNDAGLVGGDVIDVQTRAGVKRVEITGRDSAGRVAEVRVDMGAPVLGEPVRIAIGEEHHPATPGEGGGLGTLQHVTLTVQTLSMGNPHAVVMVDDVAAAPVGTWGPVIGSDAAFPEGTNVEFIAAPSRGRVVGRIFERGVGETLASGSGAAAMAVGAHQFGLADRVVDVELPGGVLRVEWGDETLHVTGPAVEVARGRLDPDWVAAAR